MNPPRETCAAARALIQKFEGLRLDAYDDGAGVWTIGWGHTRNVRRGQTITRAQAEILFEEDVKIAAEAVARLTAPIILNDHQFGALVSFVFNLGESKLKNSTLLKCVQAGDFCGAHAEFSRWVYATVRDASGRPVKVVFKGLVNRRAAEADLWSTPC